MEWTSHGHSRADLPARTSPLHGHPRVDHDDRPQEDRRPVPRHDVLLLSHGWSARSRDPHAARDAGHGLPYGAAIQLRLHDARYDDGLPVRRSGVDRIRVLYRSPAARRARHGVPAPQRALILAPPRGRHHPVFGVPRRAAGDRLDDLRPALDERVLTDDRRGSHDPRAHGPGVLVDLRRAEHDRDDLLPARAGDDLPSHHALLLERPRDELPARARDALPHGRWSPAAL